MLLLSKVLANASKFYITYFNVHYNNFTLKRPTYSIMLQVSGRSPAPVPRLHSSVAQTKFPFAHATYTPHCKTLRDMETACDVSTRRWTTTLLTKHLNDLKFKEKEERPPRPRPPSTFCQIYRVRADLGCSLCCNTTAGDFSVIPAQCGVCRTVHM